MQREAANVDVRKTVGIVGFGQMGRFVGKLLAPLADVIAYDPAHSVREPGVQRAGLSAAAGCDVVFLFPPIVRFEECCLQVAPHLRRGAIVVEGCSVMSVPTDLMRKHLPSDVDLVGCHPLFGPQSGAAGLRGFKVVLSAVRTARISEVAALFTALGVEIVHMTPDQHDRAMARTQAVEQFIGRMLLRLDVTEQDVDVPGYRKLVELRRMLEQDSEELTVAIVRNNPHAQREIDRLAAAFSDVLQALTSRRH